MRAQGNMIATDFWRKLAGSLRGRGDGGAYRSCERTGTKRKRKRGEKTLRTGQSRRRGGSRKPVKRARGDVLKKEEDQLTNKEARSFKKVMSQPRKSGKVIESRGKADSAFRTQKKPRVA